jgi:peptidoglycan/LPS O-acetylase OafA/YrhL
MKDIKIVLAQDSFTSLLDLSRWIAAFIVFAGHLHELLLSPYEQVEQPNMLIAGFYFVSGLSSEAVMVFFVISGFLIGGKNLERAKTGSFYFNSYCVDRISRLYVVLLPAILIGYCLDVIGSSYFPEAGLYNLFSYHIITEHLETSILIGNLLMLQSFYTTVIGSNFPLWSLSFEFWFYLLFGLLILSIFGSKQNKSKYWYLILSLIIVLILGYKFILYFLIWCIGLSVAFLNKKIIKSPIIALIQFIIVLIMSRFNVIAIQYLCDLLTAISFGIFLLSMKEVNNSFLCGTKKINSVLAGFSYSLYLLHYPLILFLLSLWVSIFQISNFSNEYQPNGVGIVIYFSIMIIIFTITYTFSLVTENKTALVRRWLKRKLKITI